MTDLHTQYQTLLRRGMPEHPRLWWQHAMRGWEQGFPSDQAGWRSKSHGALCGAVDEQDARDLLTIHAMRWWLKAPRKGCPWSDTESGPSDRAVILDAGEGQWWVGCSTNHLNGDWNEMRRSICILETIIASTEHLEPK